MYQVLDKDMIELEIVTYLTETKRGFKPKTLLCKIVNAILYKLKTGVQWCYLPIETLFSNEKLHYKTIFGHYRKWNQQEIWKILLDTALKK
ncbi:hypothetical protein A8C32_04690 [Flavivirga aquatica]|uniref:Insertion element IS402-like domain-containing protein n=1 Tax=Flavivirga aquatica TaxID=1849968 RepID=A0A1E5SHC9_9FLAO|nr:IS5 family transposase [Flavivirga aquatica]OEJ98514.1 hypothetical protein A8C32_04690 [Flavivirga aquatica]